MVVPIFQALGLLPERTQPYTGEQTAADHDMYGFASPTESQPAPQLSQGELGIADRLNWDMDHTTQSGYKPTEYIKPWEAEGWGSGDVATTPPTRLQTAQEQIDAQPILAQRPGFRQGQRDYEYMPTEKEQRRERAANIATIARERGTRSQDTQLPGGRPAPEPTYGRWQDTKLPGVDKRGKSTTPIQIPKEIQYDDGRFPVRIQPIPDKDEVRIQPIPDRGDPDPGLGEFMDFYNRQKSPIYDGRGNVTGYDHGYGERENFDTPIPRDQYTGPGHEMGESRLTPRPRRRERAFDVRDNWRTPRSSRGMSTSSTRNLDDRGVMTDRMKYYRR